MHDGNKEYQINKWKEILLNKLKEYNPKDTRVCVVCGKKKSINLFYSGIIKTASGHDTFRIIKKCKDCFREDIKRRHKLKMDEKSIKKRDSYKKRHRYTTLKCVYGMNKEDYESMLKSQNNKCKICNTPLSKPYIDHCHNTKKIRGILCINCNTGLGHFKDDIFILESAIKYLNRTVVDTV